MVFTEKCEHGLLWALCSDHAYSLGMQWQPMKSNPTQSLAEHQTTPVQPDSQGSLVLLYPLPLVAATTEPYTATLLSAQIGVLNYQSLTTVTATGERQTNASLTFRMPRGHWFRISRYRGGSLLLRLPMVGGRKRPQPDLPAPVKHQSW